jgi:SAM-dependent methyltransferase
MGVTLDDPGRYDEIRRILARKKFLRRLYRESYQKFAECLSRCPGEGIALELGSGAGFVKEVVPEMMTSDVIPYPGVDRILNAAAMPFEDGSLRGIFMLNVFHHLPDSGKFLTEAQRCLKPGGRVFMVDQHLGWISTWILKYGDHEPFSPESEEWSFDSSGPVSGANGALAWIVFRRDVEKFGKLCPILRLERYEPHTPLRYWISGGLKVWSLTPGWSFGMMTWVDRVLTRIHPDLGSFVDIELVKRA